jgi:hypothetical protein
VLKDNLQTNQTPLPDDLHAVPNIELDRIVTFIDRNIAAFPPYYQTIKDSNRENRITDFLVNHFQLCKTEQSGGFLPFDFRKNPTQEGSGKETDIGVFVMTRCIKPAPVLEFEAKRFSPSTNSEQYVYGKGRGGIERFKRGNHSSRLTVCGMFAYVQYRTCDEWITKVNEWISNLSKTNTDPTIDWTDKDELLVKVETFPKVEKLTSRHIRLQSKDSIKLGHYFIDLN